MNRIYIKTSKGTQSLLDGAIRLDARHIRVLGLLDGTRDPQELANLIGMDLPQAQEILQKLILVGYARSTSFSQTQTTVPAGGKFDLDTTSFGDLKTFDPSHYDDATDLSMHTPDSLELLNAAKKRSLAKAKGRETNLGSTKDVRKKTERDAHQALNDRLEKERKQREALNDRLEKERKQREAVEAELAAAKQREVEHELARKLAEEELARERAAKEERTRVAAAYEKERKEQEAVAQAKARRLGQHKKRLKWVGALSALGAACLLVMLVESTLSLSPESCSEMLTQWSKSKSKAESCSASFFPIPHFEAQQISVGDITIERTKGTLHLFSLFLGKFEPTGLIVYAPKIKIESFDGLLRSPSIRKLDRLREINIESARIDIGNAYINDLKGSLNLSTEGHIDQIVLNDEEHGARLAFSIEKGVTKAYVQARFADSATAPIPGLKDLSFDAKLHSDGMTIEQGSITHPAGVASFSGDLKWANKQWVLAGKFDWNSIRLNDLAPWLFASGRASISGVYEASGNSPTNLISSATLTGQGDSTDMSLKIDLPETLGVSSSTGQTNFSTGKVKIDTRRDKQNFMLDNLANGPMRSSVEVSIDSNGSITGNAKAEMPSRGLSSDSILSGTKTRMVLSSRQKN